MNIDETLKRMSCKVEDRICPNCGRTFQVTVGGRGRPRKYCQYKCTLQAANRRHKKQ